MSADKPTPGNEPAPGNEPTPTTEPTPGSGADQQRESSPPEGSDTGSATAQDPGLHPVRHRLTGKQASSALIGVLTLLLGFAIAIQVRATSNGDALSGLPEEDLIGILDNQNARADRLREQIASLQQNLEQLHNSGDRSAAARQQASTQRATLGILLGTLPATGPGIVATVTDPHSALDGESLFDIIEELRGAGAEAIQFGPVRVSTTTSITGSGGHVQIDDVEISPPYRVTAIGDAATLDTALNIPGGVAATVRTAGGSVSVSQRSSVSITVVHALAEPRYAKPTK